MFIYMAGVQGVAFEERGLHSGCIGIAMKLIRVLTALICALIVLAAIFCLLSMLRGAPPQVVYAGS